MTNPQPAPSTGPVIPLNAAPVATAEPPDMVKLSPAAAVMTLQAHGLSVNVALVDVDGRVLWEGSSVAGRSRLHANPPQEILARTAVVQVYLSNGPQGADVDRYAGHLACGCTVVYGYRPGVIAHCPRHGNQPVSTVDYPADAYDTEPAARA